MLCFLFGTVKNVEETLTEKCLQFVTFATQDFLKGQFIIVFSK